MNKIIIKNVVPLSVRENRRVVGEERIERSPAEYADTLVAVREKNWAKPGARQKETFHQPYERVIERPFHGGRVSYNGTPIKNKLQKGKHGAENSKKKQ